MEPQIEWGKLLSGLFGALVSLRFVKGTFVERTLMVLGGCALTYFGAENVAGWMKMTGAIGLVGFLLGLFGMAILSKVFEVLALLDAKRMAVDLWELWLRKWRA